ncbi:alpha-elapitoxin-Al2b-like [Scomber scombrus]|uniref:Alpha-elapitoxin-Al2b-like n=1 Tax=Scomber scombrus TaxID=13677 RepID=A0AAV1P6B2_SCOSC
MNKVLFGIVAVVASFVLVESLTCNKCAFGLVGLCFSSTTESCTTNTSVCFTGKASFPSLTSFSGFNSQGCSEPAACNTTTNSTLLGVTYELKVTCCSTDKCNPASSAPVNKMTFAAVAGLAVMASVWGSWL